MGVSFHLRLDRLAIAEQGTGVAVDEQVRALMRGVQTAAARDGPQGAGDRFTLEAPVFGVHALSDH